MKNENTEKYTKKQILQNRPTQSFTLILNYFKKTTKATHHTNQDTPLYQCMYIYIYLENLKPLKT